jgi:hypothetical protein
MMVRVRARDSKLLASADSLCGKEREVKQASSTAERKNVHEKMAREDRRRLVPHCAQSHFAKSLIALCHLPCLFHSDQS